jgi:hypothetical protein
LAQSASFEQLAPSTAGCIPLLPEPDVPPLLAPLLLAPLLLAPLLEEPLLVEPPLLAPAVPEAPPSPDPPASSPSTLASRLIPASIVEPLFEEQASKSATAPVTQHPPLVGTIDEWSLTPSKSLPCFARRLCEVTESR